MRTTALPPVRKGRAGRTARRRRDGLVAIRSEGRWRRALGVLAEGALVLVPLAFALGFVLPASLLPIPLLSLAVALWMPVAARTWRRPVRDRAPVIPLRARRSTPRGSRPLP